MTALRKASIRELTQAAYRLDGHFLQGIVRRNPETGEIMVGDKPLDQWIVQFEDKEITLIGLDMDSDKPMDRIICRTCGTEYTGYECPKCREARLRLRGR